VIERAEIDIMGKKIAWKGFLALAIAQANFCEMHWHRSRGGASYIMIVGRVHNVAITKSIYEYLCTTVERLAASGVKAEKRNYREYLTQIAGTGIQAYSQPNWRTWKSSFILGCSRRLCDRLKAQKRAYQSNGIPAEPGLQGTLTLWSGRQTIPSRRATKNLPLTA
jgi:hypothetical protein